MYCKHCGNIVKNAAGLTQIDVPAFSFNAKLDIEDFSWFKKEK